MLNKYSKEVLILPSRCDHNSKLSISNCFAEFMDIATEHAELLGIGADAMSSKNLFWLTAKTKVHINSLPKMMEKVTITTWPEKAERIVCNRDYTISNENGLLVTGKTQWAVLNTATQRIERADGIFPADLVFIEESALPDSFALIPDKFDSEPIGEYIVKSTDIDLGHHMNNISYVRATLGLFSTEEINNMNIKDIEVQFKNQCFEGDKLYFYKLETENGLLIKAALENNKTVLLVSIS